MQLGEKAVSLISQIATWLPSLPVTAVGKLGGWKLVNFRVYKMHETRNNLFFYLEINTGVQVIRM